MTNDSGTGTLAADSWSVTPSKVVKFSHVWKIENFSFYQKDKVIVSPPFSVVPDDGIQWCLKVFPNGKSGDNKDHVSIYLSLLACKLAGLPAKYRIAILNSKQEAVQSMENNEALRFKCGRGWGFGRFISRDFLLTNCEDSLPKDTLTVFCEVTTLSEAESISGQSGSADGFYGFSPHPMADTHVMNEGNFPVTSRIAVARPAPSDGTYESQIPDDQPAWSARASDRTSDNKQSGNKVPNLRDYEPSFASARDLIAVLQKENQLLADMLDDMKAGMLRSMKCLQGSQENESALPLDVVTDKLRTSQARNVFENTQRCLRSQSKACEKMLNDLAAAEEVLRRPRRTSAAKSPAPMNPAMQTFSASPEQTQSPSSTDQPTSFGFLGDVEDLPRRHDVRQDRFATVATEFVPGKPRSAPESLETYARASLGTIDEAVRSRSLDLPQTSDPNRAIGLKDAIADFTRRHSAQFETGPRIIRKLNTRKVCKDQLARQRNDPRPNMVFSYQTHPLARSNAEPRLNRAGSSD